MKFTLLVNFKCTIQVLLILSIFTVSCSHYHYPFLERFHHSNQKLYIKQLLPVPCPCFLPYALVIAILLSWNLCILGTSNKWNHANTTFLI